MESASKVLPTALVFNVLAEGRIEMSLSTPVCAHTDLADVSYDHMLQELLHNPFAIHMFRMLAMGHSGSILR